MFWRKKQENTQETLLSKEAQEANKRMKIYNSMSSDAERLEYCRTHTPEIYNSLMGDLVRNGMEIKG